MMRSYLSLLCVASGSRKSECVCCACEMWEQMSLSSLLSSIEEMVICGCLYGRRSRRNSPEPADGSRMWQGLERICLMDSSRACLCVFGVKKMPCVLRNCFVLFLVKATDCCVNCEDVRGIVTGEIRKCVYVNFVHFGRDTPKEHWAHLR